MEILLNALEQGVAPALIVVVYLITTDIIKSRKDKNSAKINSETVKAISDINVIVKEIYDKKESENREKVKIAIDSTFDSAAFNLINFIQRTLISNHLDTNKSSVIANIHNAANSEYYKIYQTLSLYEINGKRVSEYIDSQWLKEIETDLIDSIYNKTLNREDKMMGYVNKVTLRFRTYVNYIQNKILK